MCGHPLLPACPLPSAQILQLFCHGCCRFLPIAWQALSINGNQFAEPDLLVLALKTARQLRALCVSDPSMAGGSGPGIREWAQIKVGGGGEAVLGCRVLLGGV